MPGPLFPVPAACQSMPGFSVCSGLFVDLAGNTDTVDFRLYASSFIEDGELGVSGSCVCHVDDRCERAEMDGEKQYPA